MNRDVIVTCAVTGAGDTAGRHPDLPITPKQIAEAAKTGQPSRKVEYYAEVVERIRDSEVDPVINLTAGMGGDFFPKEDNPAEPGPGSDLVGPLERLAHVEALRPEICSLDCGTLNFGDGTYISTPPMLRTMAARIKELGVKPELECFDTGHLWFANQLVKEELVEDPPLYQICLGIPWGAPATTAAMKTMVEMVPAGANWTAFAISAMEMPMVAQSVLLGGHVRVGLEDNLYLERGVFASNAQLVEKAVRIIELLGARVVGPAEARETLGLRPRG
jgi:uncharacterized protein (DUF849 family)